MGFMDKLKKNQNANNDQDFKPMKQNPNQRPPMQNGPNANFNLQQQNPNQQMNPPQQQGMPQGVPPLNNPNGNNMPPMGGNQQGNQENNPSQGQNQPFPNMNPSMPGGNQQGNQGGQQNIPPNQNTQKQPNNNPNNPANNGGFPNNPNQGQNPGFPQGNQNNDQMIKKQKNQSNDTEIDLQQPQSPQGIGGQTFERDKNKPNPLANKKANTNNLDKKPNNMPNMKLKTEVDKIKVEPEYYGKLRPLFENPNISSIHMYGHELITYQLNGQDVVGQSLFESEDEYINLLNDLINWNTDKNPHYVDINTFRKDNRTFGTFYLKDLSRCHIAVTEDEIYATIAVKRQDTLSLDDLCSKYNMFDEKVKNFIYEAIQSNAKILLAGQGGAGKTTFIQACGNLMNHKNVTLVAEEYRELLLNRPNVKYISAGENRPLYKVVAESTKMRIRNLIVGEVIGQEALAMLEAMNTGLDSVLATTHANGAQHALSRLITLACYNPNINPKFVKNLIGENIDMIIFLEEINGQKKLSEIITIERYQEEVDKIIANKIYDFRKNKTTIQSSTSGRLFNKIAEYKRRQRERY